MIWMTHNYFFLASSHDLLNITHSLHLLFFSAYLLYLGFCGSSYSPPSTLSSSSSSSSTAAAAAAYTPSSGVCQQLYCRNVYEKRVRIHLFWSDQVPQYEDRFLPAVGRIVFVFFFSAPVHLIAYVLCGQRLIARKVHILRFGAKCVLIMCYQIRLQIIAFVVKLNWSWFG